MTSRPPCTGAALLRPSPALLRPSPALLRPYGAAIPPPVRAPRGCAPRPRCCAPTAPPSRPPVWAQRCCAPTCAAIPPPVRAPRGCAPTCAAIPPPVRAQRCCAPRPRCCAPTAPRGCAPRPRCCAPTAPPSRPPVWAQRGCASPLRPYSSAGPNSARRSGSAKTCIGGADATTRPSCITTTVSAHCRATVRSWVASSTVTPCSTSRSKIAKI
jgi:hypothetical protein